MGGPRVKIPSTEYRWIKPVDIALELGLSVRQAETLLAKVSRLMPYRVTEYTSRRSSDRGPKKYPAEIVEVCRALLGEGHRSLEPPERDWLARYLQQTNE